MDTNDQKARARESNFAVLRAAVAAYLLYLGASLLRDELSGASGLSPWVGWLFGTLFLLSGLAFGWYTWRRWRRLSSSEEAPAEAEEHREEHE